MPKSRPDTVKPNQIMAMIEEQGYRCAYSGRELTPQTASLDHVTPVSAGGGHGVDNVRVVHHLVNSAKGVMTLAEFISLCRDVTRHQDERDRQTDDTQAPVSGSL